MKWRQPIILDEGAADAGSFAARPTEIIDEFIRPIAEQRSVNAETRATKIVAAAEIDARWRVALSVIGGVELNQRAQFRTEIAIGSFKGRPPAFERDAHIPVTRFAKVGILRALTALQILDLGGEIVKLAIQTFNSGRIIVARCSAGMGCKTRTAARGEQHEGECMSVTEIRHPSRFHSLPDTVRQGGGITPPDSGKREPPFTGGII